MTQQTGLPLDELGRRLRRLGKRFLKLIGLSLFTLGIVFGTVFARNEEILKLLLVPAGDLLSPFEGGKPIYTGPTEMFGVIIRLAWWSSVAAGFTVFAFGTYRIIKPGLLPVHRYWITRLIPVSLGLFLGGAIFVYTLLLPRGLGFLIGINDVAVALISITGYLKLLIQLMFWMGVMAQFPLVTFALVKFKTPKLNYQRWKWGRRLAPWVAWSLGVVVTPGLDPVNATLMAFPIYALYEIGIFTSWLADPSQGDYLWIKALTSKLTAPIRRLNRWLIKHGAMKAI